MILKSVFYSLRCDPIIKNLLIKHQIPASSPALTYFKPKNMEKEDLPGIENYNMRGIKVELDHNSLLLMSEKYIKLPQLLNTLTLKTIGAHKLFRFPFDIGLLVAQKHPDFKRLRPEDLATQVNTFPLHHA